MISKWDRKFYSLCIDISKWSKDPDTKHGAIIVDKHNNIVSTGYNGPPRNIDDTKVPLTRPLKYLYFCHAEANALISAGRIGRSAENCTIYQTGQSCTYCWLLVANSGIKRVVCGNTKSKCVDPANIKVQQNMADQIGIKIDYI